MSVNETLLLVFNKSFGSEGYNKRVLTATIFIELFSGRNGFGIDFRVAEICDLVDSFQSSKAATDWAT